MLLSVHVHRTNIPACHRYLGKQFRDASASGIEKMKPHIHTQTHTDNPVEIPTKNAFEA